MPTPSVETVRGWSGRVMVDRDGKRLGEITDIYLDRETDRPEWAVVHTGLFGLRSTFVPLAEATEVDDQIQVPHQRTLVKDAPNIEADGQLSEAEEAELYRHYGLDYDTVTTDSDPAADLAPGPAADDRTRGTPASTTQPVGPSQGSAERRHGEQLAAPDTAGTIQPGAEDAFAVGEGISRPFVYETPGPPQDHPVASRRRQPGQVRLRRYLVTEVVTETEAGQRHELRVEREPVDDTEVAGVPARSGQPVETADTPPPAETDDNDWFRPQGDPPR
jgi:hypothetical protein